MGPEDQFKIIVRAMQGERNFTKQEEKVLKNFSAMKSKDFLVSDKELAGLIELNEKEVLAKQV